MNIAAQENGEPLPTRRVGWWRRYCFPGLSLAILALNVVLFALRPDWAAAWTLWPFWLYAVPGLTLAALSGALGKAGRKRRFWLYVCWVLALVVLADETRGCLRWFLPVSHQPTIRAISLNCSVGRLEAAAEVAPYKPDIVLLQETPSRSAVAELSRQLCGQNGNYTWGPEAAVLANGNVKPIALNNELKIFATAARVTTKNTTFTVVSLRLATPPFRVEWWSPEVWRVQAQHHAVQRRQLQKLREFFDTLPAEELIVTGGDCNAPGGDGIFREFKPQLHDAYYEGGRGWCNTFMSEFPVLRIDQFWLSQNCRAYQLQAKRTRYSDHRLVICDLIPKK